MADSEAEQLDAVIIGTGQGGKPLAGALAEAGWKSAIVERDERVGGTCVLRGCTPTKTMVASARVAHLARRAPEYGVETGGVSVDMRTVRRRKREIVESWSQGSRRGMERHDTLELIMGEARFVGEREVEVALRDGGTRRLRAEKVFINAGGRPTVPDLPGLDEVPWLDSTSIMELGEVPEHLLVLGGGFVGLEFAQMFRRFGAEVTVIERAPRLAPREDEDVCETLGEIFREDGIGIRTGAEATAVEPADGGGVRLQIRGEEGPGPAGSHLLVAVGRTPNTEALNLSATGLSPDERGYIPVNGRRETEVEGIWALGDVTGGPPFTHTSYDDYRIVEANLLNGGDRTADDRLVPYVVYIDPQLARVGLSEKEAREAGRPVRVAKLPMRRVARAQETDETRGFMKAVVDAESERILGAAVFGVEGGEVMSVIQMAMMGDLPYTALRDGVFAHPTLAESLNNLFMTLDP